MTKQSSMLKIAQAIAQEAIANQTQARLSIAFDAALIAAHEVFQLGPGRAAAFANAYADAMDDLAGLFIADCDENNDKQLVYAKAKRDELIRSIVGDKLFRPFDLCYGNAVMDEMKRIRVIKEEHDA